MASKKKKPPAPEAAQAAEVEEAVRLDERARRPGRQRTPGEPYTVRLSDRMLVAVKEYSAAVEQETGLKPDVPDTCVALIRLGLESKGIQAR